jgi:hypothetical protein
MNSVNISACLAEKAGLPDSCCHENLEYLFEIKQVKVLGSVTCLLGSDFIPYLYFSC